MQTVNLEDKDLDYVSKNRKQILPVELTDIEVAVLAKERAKEEAKLAELKSKFGDEKKEWQDKISMQERVVEKMGEDIAREKQDRVVLCDEIFKSGQILTIRQDNGIVVGSRPASASEAQRYLPAVEGAGILNEAAKAQKDANVEETDDGDVVPPDGSDEPKKRGKKK